MIFQFNYKQHLKCALFAHSFVEELGLISNLVIHDSRDLLTHIPEAAKSKNRGSTLVRVFLLWHLVVEVQREDEREYYVWVRNVFLTHMLKVWSPVQYPEVGLLKVVRHGGSPSQWMDSSSLLMTLLHYWGKIEARKWGLVGGNWPLVWGGSCPWGYAWYLFLSVSMLPGSHKVSSICLPGPFCHDVFSLASHP